MKKKAAFLLVVAILFSLSACANNKSSVPDQLIESHIKSEFDGTDYAYVMSHSMDKSTHIDTVTVETVVTGEYYSEYHVGVIQYRYNRANDTWDLYGFPDWRHIKTDYFDYGWDGHCEFPCDDDMYTVNISTINFEELTVTGTFWARNYLGDELRSELNTSGTYELKEDRGTYWFKIIQSGYVYKFMYTKDSGARLKYCYEQ